MVSAKTLKYGLDVWMGQSITSKLKSMIKKQARNKRI